MGVVFFWRGNARLGTLTYVGVLSLPPPPATVDAEKQAFSRYCHGSLNVYVCGCVGRKWLDGDCIHGGVDARNYVLTTLLYLQKSTP